MRYLFALLCCLAWPVSAQQTTADVAEDAAARLQAAERLLRQASSASDRVAALTATVKAYEDGLIAMRDGLRRAAVREKTLETQLISQQEEISQLLGVLQSMSRAPAPVLLLHPLGPTGTARSGMIVAEVTPALQDQTDALRLQLEEIALLGTLQRDATQVLQVGLQGAQDARAALSQSIQERSDLPRRFSENSVQTALLVASAETLDDFAAGLRDAYLAGVAPIRDGVRNKGALNLPVQGQLLRRYNAPDAAGIVRPGVILATRPRALVTSPVAATILFHGPLLDYGTVIILEPTTDVLFVIAGLAQVYGEPGQVIPAGSPIGVLGGGERLNDANLTQSDAILTGTQTQTLYLEVREGQSPVDPALWFALDGT
jgi:septal ring factor EnvC (AmiA/AmiB activator)